jgi:hypothetical protein
MNHLTASEPGTNVVIASVASALLESHYADLPEYSDIRLIWCRRSN